ncbi:nucleotide pyrophosphatase, partial [Burkholderia sp. SIMBA_048]
TQSAVSASVALLAGLYSAGAAAFDVHDHELESVKHVLLISFDGLHEQDVARCVGSNACPNLALLARSGTTYTNAHTPGLSDSFPG